MQLSTIQKSPDGRKIDRIGRVTIVKHHNSFRLRLKVNYKQINITISGGITLQTLKTAKDTANKINSELALKCFDIRNYKETQKTTELTLIDIWNNYKEIKKHQIAPTTQSRLWKDIDKFLKDIPAKANDMQNIENLASHGLKIRAAGTLHRYFTSLNAAIKLVTGEHENLKSQLPKMQRKTIQWFEPLEIKAILEAFREDTYNSANSSYAHSYYYPYVAFLALTGCRPEEAIALTWNDLQWGRKGCKAQISKVYSKGILMPVTKNHIARVIPLAPKLAEILKPLEGKETLFSSPTGGYLNHSNFYRRQWCFILDNLVKDEKIVTRLRPYCLRHSYVTNLHYEHGVSLVAIAQLIGDRPETVMRCYTGLKNFEPDELPDLY
ncbi:tyrosine-type recombinase/integrase [Spirulina sp. 06S082]|uniref:tyrosine-type recombinase/integrase n=1 Tax=Spirulina sp. 06S082 TaxID=3110248 RepID=UPI002B21CA71|nr:tyrosine-type recombinase/integrase [Spirulina sp. 06S082]MEA5469353.1 tyrosine-type recombinase/integrase [Spirulina sp. 06S082]